MATAMLDAESSSRG